MKNTKAFYTLPFYFMHRHWHFSEYPNQAVISHDHSMCKYTITKNTINLLSPRSYLININLFLYIFLKMLAQAFLAQLMNSLGRDSCLSMKVKPPTSEIMFFRQDKNCGNSNLLLQHSKFLKVSVVF